MKGFKDKSGKFRPTENKKGVRMSRDQSAKTQGVKIEKIRMAREKEMNLDDVMKKHEKEFEKSLNEYHFDNPQLRNKNWDVGITYEGGFGEEYFSFWAGTPKYAKSKALAGSDVSVTYRSFLSNFDWSEGLDEDIQERIEKDPDFAQKEYDKWLTDSFDTVADGFFEQLVGAIEDEYSQ